LPAAAVTFQALKRNIMNTNENNQPHQQEAVSSQPEFLPVRPGFEDHPDCLCGPDAMKDSFWACDINGTLIIPGEETPQYMLCQYCGRIIDATTLKVIGKRDAANVGDEIDKLYC
jgi:hypothetical protein